MVAIKGVSHFTIAVSDLERSVRFYRDVVGLQFVASYDPPGIAFLDAGGDGILLVRQEAPIHRHISAEVLAHHAFRIDANNYARALDHLRANGVEVLYEETRENGLFNGTSAYFRDPDGTVLEYLNLTSYEPDRPRG
jgi:catechol 2,3-dioxygenase-like lactoylglutathione lyase family enzyme